MSTWEAVAQLRWQYQERIREEHLAHEIHLSDCACPDKRAVWQASMRRKSVAFIAYREALTIAAKSGQKHPGT